MLTLLAYLESLLKGQFPRPPGRQEMLHEFGVARPSELPDGGKFDFDKVLDPRRYKVEAVRSSAERLKRTLDRRRRARLEETARAFEPDFLIPDSALPEMIEVIVADLRTDCLKRVLALHEDVNALRAKLGQPSKPPPELTSISDDQLIQLHDQLCREHEFADRLNAERQRQAHAA